MPNHSRDEMMLLAAWMYYQDELTHREIAERLHTSRVKITRLLKEARETGIVEIKVMKPLPHHHELARELERTFGLSEAMVVNSNSHPATEIGQAAAEHFHFKVGDNCIVGFGWSSTVRYMADYIQNIKHPHNCRVVELVGSMMGQENPYSISSRVAETIQTTLYPLPVPVIVQNENAYAAFLAEPSIQQNLALAKQSDIAFVGVGNIGLHSTLVDTGYVDKDAIAWLLEQGVVGDVLMRYFDIEGKLILTPWDKRIIGLGWQDLQSLPYVTVLAYGPQKVEALLGLLRSGIPDCLITDVSTGELVIKKHKQKNA